MNTETCSVCGACVDYMVQFSEHGDDLVSCSACSNAVQTLANAESIATATKVGVGSNASFYPFAIDQTVAQNN